MPNKKNKSLAVQLATQGPTKAQQRTARQVAQYDELVKKQGPLTKEDAAQVKAPPTKRERKVARALKHQANLARKEARRANRSNIRAILEATKRSRPPTDDGYLEFCGDVIIQSEDEAIRTATEASAAAFNPYHRVLFVNGTRGKLGKLGAATAVSGMRSAGAAVVCKMPSGNNNDNNNVGQIWEKKLFGLNLPPNNPTIQNIEAGLLSVAGALGLVAVQMASAKDDRMPSNDKSSTRSKVTVFTDNRGVVSKISNTKLTAQQLESTPCLEKLITRSECLRHLGVDVELRWSPRRQKSEGSKRAEAASLRAAKSHWSCKSVDSVDDGLQILIDSLEQQ